MSRITARWDDQDHAILRVTYGPRWNWTDFEQHLRVEHSLFDNAPQCVATILDLRNTQIPLGAISRLPQIAASPHYRHPNSGLVVMVGSPPFLHEVVNLLQRVYPAISQKLHLAADLDAAYDCIRAWHRSSAGDILM